MLQICGAWSIFDSFFIIKMSCDNPSRENNGYLKKKNKPKTTKIPTKQHTTQKFVSQISLWICSIKADLLKHHGFQEYLGSSCISRGKIRKNQNMHHGPVLCRTWGLIYYLLWNMDTFYFNSELFWISFCTWSFPWISAVSSYPNPDVGGYFHF